MDFTKYRRLLIQKINQQLSLWFKSEDNQLIQNKEVYQFLHSLKGSAGTLQLERLYQLSTHLLEKIELENEKQWKKVELRIFLSDLILLANNYENFSDAKQQSQYHEENVPLIQIISDDASMLILLKAALEAKDWMVITNSDPKKAIAQYFHFNPDCVILDTDLSHKNGFEVVRGLQNYSVKAFVPIFMLSFGDDRQTRIKAFQMGVDDFMTKPVDMEELTVRVERHLKRKQLYDQSVMFDELTNLYNRRFLKDAFQRNIDCLERSGHPFSLAILDIDYFKKVNDTYGHLTGDKVLLTFAEFLKKHTRNGDIVFRYGGEEFIILFQNTDHSQAIEIVTRLLEAFSNQQFEAENGQTFSITFSAGVNTICDVETTMEAAISGADQVLYKAKESGRSRVGGVHQPSKRFGMSNLFISVVDDDPIIRIVLMRVLQELKIGYYDIDVQTFADGQRFFQSGRLEQHGEHFLILDRILPVMDGLEVLQKVKQREDGKDVLVMMLTGIKSESDIAKALELGADDYMTKPFDFTELQSRIKQLIQRMNH